MNRCHSSLLIISTWITFDEYKLQISYILSFDCAHINHIHTYIYTNQWIYRKNNFFFGSFSIAFVIIFIQNERKKNTNSTCQQSWERNREFSSIYLICALWINAFSFDYRFTYFQVFVYYYFLKKIVVYKHKMAACYINLILLFKMDFTNRDLFWECIILPKPYESQTTQTHTAKCKMCRRI